MPKSNRSIFTVKKSFLISNSNKFLKSSDIIKTVALFDDIFFFLKLFLVLEKNIFFFSFPFNKETNKIECAYHWHRFHKIFPNWNDIFNIHPMFDQSLLKLQKINKINSSVISKMRESLIILTSNYSSVTERNIF